MPNHEQTIADAIQIFERADYPSGLSTANAWLGIYQALLWYEPVNWVGFSNLPHIIDADKLRPASATKRRTWTRPKAWQKRAHALSIYLVKHLRCPEDSLSLQTDLLMKHPDYEGMQRQNKLGMAFVGLVKYRVNLDLWYPGPPMKGGHRHGHVTVRRSPDPPHGGPGCDPSHRGRVSAVGPTL